MDGASILETLTSICRSRRHARVAVRGSPRRVSRREAIKQLCAVRWSSVIPLMPGVEVVRCQSVSTVQEARRVTRPPHRSWPAAHAVAQRHRAAGDHVRGSCDHDGKSGLDLLLGGRDRGQLSNRATAVPWLAAPTGGRRPERAAERRQVGRSEACSGQALTAVLYVCCFSGRFQDPERPFPVPRKGPLTWFFKLVAGVGFEPSTFGL